MFKVLSNDEYVAAIRRIDALHQRWRWWLARAAAASHET
jgi:hypothetical protein